MFQNKTTLAGTKPAALGLVACHRPMVEMQVVNVRISVPVMGTMPRPDPSAGRTVWTTKICVSYERQLAAQIRISLLNSTENAV